MARKKRDKNLYEINYWPSFTDVIVSLLMIFIFFIMTQFLTSQENIQSLILKSRQSQFQEKFQDEYKGLYGEARSRDITFKVDGNIQRISFASNLLFESGALTLSEAGERIIKMCAGIFTSIKDDKGNLIYDKIQVEGYTDRVPITAGRLTQMGIESNWELSAKRAINVVKILGQEGVPFELLSAVGYGEYQSESTEDSPENLRAKDRKIELVLFYSTTIEE